MILDNLNQWQRYVSLSPRLLSAFAFLQEVDSTWKSGRYDIDGDLVHAIVQKYTTHPIETSPVEAHRKYIDVHYLVAGQEILMWVPLASLTQVSMPYEEERDTALFTLVPSATSLRLSAGQFAILFPEDGHAPGCIWDTPCEVFKVVVKVYDECQRMNWKGTHRASGTGTIINS